MTANPLRARRATLDDLDALKSLWASMRLPVDEMEKRLTEFQVAEDVRGHFAGAIGLQIVRQHALLHSEEYPNFADADEARALFWERIQTLAATHGVFRVWTQEQSPFWTRLGFFPAGADLLSRLPPEWSRREGQWFSLQLKNEEVINAALENQFAGFLAEERKQTEHVLEKTQTLKTVITVLGFAIGIICIGLAIYLLARHPLLAR